MYRVTSPLALILSLFLISNLAALAQNYSINESYDDKNTVTAKLLPLVGTPPTSGYMPFRLILKNGAKGNKNWDLSFISKTKDYYGYSSRRGNNLPTLSSEFSYSCPPESSKTYDILVPITTSIASLKNHVTSTDLTIELSLNGNNSYSSLSSYQYLTLPATLLSTDLYVQHSSTFDSLIPHSSRGYGGGSYTTEFTPSALSSDWRAYSGFDALICTDEDWLNMSVETRTAILEWNRLGGNIYIYRLNPASNFRSLGIDKDNIRTKGSSPRSFGQVTIKPLSDIKSLDVKSVHTLINKSKTHHPKAQTINTSYSNSSYSSSSYSLSSTWSLMKTLGKLSFSPIYLILILVAFGILVGPVNLFVFAKSGQRHRLFITTPLIAIGASILLIALIIIQDGFGGHGQRVQLVEVRADGGENKAYVWQEQAARTGVILGGSFETSSNAYMSPLPISESRFSRVTRENAGGSCNYTADQGENGILASGDWFQSRSAHGHYLESVISTRGRINLKSSQGAPAPELNSSFNYDIDTIVYIDDSGKTWQASDLGAGESITLVPATQAEALALIHEQQKNMSLKLQMKLDKLRKRKNHFIALTDEAPAIDTLGSIEWSRTASIITGPVVK